MENKSICKNCNSEISGSYCSSCGQRTTIHKVTFKETFQDFMDVVFSINSPLFLTLKLLVINPGKLFNEYLNGKRKTYYRPVPFFILTTIVFVLIRVLLDYDPMENMVVVGNESMDQSLINNAGIFMAKNINNIIFTFVFSFAIFVKLFFYKKYTFAEYLAVSFYVIGFYIIITTILMFGLQYAGAQYRMVPFIILFFYMIYVLTSLFKKNKVLTILKTVFVFLFSIFFYMIFGYGISFLIVWLKTL
ncbi:DUF3667 domain-containing protein [Xanthomarina spongicola]|uniref:Uncharacterized protein DUF3667 n=1 Tax=Xanthomarina spongicola TaxID=570520 RepID=A0A316DLR8_9FLAO|nr:DUF3667 domain-containing protein [Xanthomarina spongicola]PWK19011.1 uncharacterized protein DUF3667 [Xanthomarina spongicola]